MADQCIVCLENLDVAVPSPQLQSATTAATTTSTTATASDVKQEETTPEPATPSTVPVKEEHQHHDHDNIAVIQVCGHVLHDSCLKEWTAKANSCPICRQSFHLVQVYDKVGGKLLSTYKVEEKKQVAEFDPQAWLDENPEEEEESTPCPVCSLADHEDVLLLCDGCDTPYHTYCIGLDSVPRGSWFCMECQDLLGEEIENSRPSFPSTNGRNGFFPRTQASMRRARNRARSDEWQGAWGQVAGAIWDAISLDLDSHDGDDALEEYRRSQQLRERERREYQRWQQRLNIASRLGVRDVFARNIQDVVGQQVEPQSTPQPTRESREERLAWGALDRARELDVASPSNQMKESISNVVRSALKPHWKSSQLTAEQYATINRDVSHKLYEEVTDPATVDDDARRTWEKIASKEVARALAELKA
ncbi:putative phd and ring finger domain protein [Phaeoacremonium minimum UCRPA7]|uniref:Putative phd and ring finger domain protein n=1 Tax=Phaeoacremonium minimum (strain UCR-PA7) TaxID=1286976 RepID=R8BTU9_PHAM7|nr:putative phd and ring finger domain protein [Phaeoacremonium minimum UCRPA7]EOO02724.1 putative phd and ring finger domain protein [Phaeoacremonium minimum UCRPA7]